MNRLRDIRHFRNTKRRLIPFIQDLPLLILCRVAGMLEPILADIRRGTGYTLDSLASSWQRTSHTNIIQQFGIPTQTQGKYANWPQNNQTQHFLTRCKVTALTTATPSPRPVKQHYCWRLCFLMRWLSSQCHTLKSAPVSMIDDHDIDSSLIQDRTAGLDGGSW